MGSQELSTARGTTLIKVQAQDARVPALLNRIAAVEAELLRTETKWLALQVRIDTLETPRPGPPGGPP